ncbi:MAG: DUF2807 domain-containing protein [Bacteroidales bacterium]|nr:DUF2807 domain-containing protein [Bacteroidales bacterium]
MKTFKWTSAFLLFTLLSSTNIEAQVKGDGNVVKQERQVASFNSINVGCAINLFFTQGDVQQVAVEIDENLQDKLKTKVNNGELVLSCDNVRNATKMNVYVTSPAINKIDANGASVVKGLSPIQADHFKLLASGASKVNLEISAKSVYNEASGASKENLIITADDLNTEISGAADVNLSGTAIEHKTEVSGAGKLKAIEFVTDNTNAEISGAGNASIMARKQLKADLSGAGTLTYFDNNEVKKIGKTGEYIMTFTGMENVKSVKIDEGANNADNDDENTVVANTDDNGNVEVTINNDRIVVVTDDSVRVTLGDNTLEVNEDGDVKIKRDKKKQKFNGHWKGLELGVNGYLTPDYDLNYPSEYSLLDQKYQKSIAVNLNFFEQNINLIKNHVGLVTGLGITWNNYRFDDDVRLLKGDNKLILERATGEDITFEKSKLVNTYLTLPLMLEVQTNRNSKANSFHLSGGLVGGWRIGTHTKYVYDDGSRQKDKDRKDFYMNPFKLDAIAKIGWGVLNLYATYSLTPMFQKNKGPELYPFAIGISLTDLSDL